MKLLFTAKLQCVIKSLNLYRYDGMKHLAHFSCIVSFYREFVTFSRRRHHHLLPFFHFSIFIAILLFTSSLELKYTSAVCRFGQLNRCTNLCNIPTQVYLFLVLRSYFVVGWFGWSLCKVNIGFADDKMSRNLSHLKLVHFERLAILLTYIYVYIWGILV